MQQAYEKLNNVLYLTRAKFMPGEDWVVNGAIINGSETSVVWDTLSKPSDLYFIDSIIPEGNRVVAVYSHADWDHCWGTDGYPFDAILAHQSANDRFSNELPSILKRMNKKHGDVFGSVTLVPPDFIFDFPVKLDLGDRTLELIPFPSHTVDSIIGFIPEDGILLIGDAAEHIPEINEARLVPEWIAGLRRWAKDPRLKLVIPGHGEPSGAEFLTATADYLNTLMEGKTISVTKEASQDRATHRANVKKIKAFL